MATFHKVVKNNGEVQYMDDEDYKMYKNRNGCIGIIVCALVLMFSLFGSGPKKSNESTTTETSIETTSSTSKTSIEAAPSIIETFDAQSPIDALAENESQMVRQEVVEEIENTEKSSLVSDENSEPSENSDLTVEAQ